MRGLGKIRKALDEGGTALERMMRLRAVAESLRQEARRERTAAEDRFWRLYDSLVPTARFELSEWEDLIEEILCALRRWFESGRMDFEGDPEIEGLARKCRRRVDEITRSERHRPFMRGIWAGFS